jgi:hypothetical protein
MLVSRKNAKGSVVKDKGKAEQKRKDKYFKEGAKRAGGAKDAEALAQGIGGEEKYRENRMRSHRALARNGSNSFE